jgi:poly(A) polymerase
MEEPLERAPTILDRSRHPISRRDIDPDALKVLYRLHNHGFIAYLVGGAVRDLMLGRKPADFDIGTNARPNQIKKLFRNCFLVGRRFRLAHVRFQGGKVIEVSTFRKGPDGWSPEPAAAGRGHEDAGVEAALGGPEAEAAEPGAGGFPEHRGEPAEGRGEGQEEEAAGEPAPAGHKAIAFGTPAEDARRRDITINALFYDIATFAVIDYVGGLEDLAARRVRIIGEPDERFAEDPVRVWRVLRHAARLGFEIEARTAAAIPGNIARVGLCPGARLYEELSKDLKSGSMAPFLEKARLHGLLPVILGGIGRFYQDSDERFGLLRRLLGPADRVEAAGGQLTPTLLLSILLWPWAEPILASAEGDRLKALQEAFRAAGPAALIPRAVAVNVFQTLYILQHMLKALETGRVKWGIKKRPQFPEASALLGLLREGKLESEEGTFDRLYRSRFGSRRPRRRRQPRPGVV